MYSLPQLETSLVIIAGDVSPKGPAFPATPIPMGIVLGTKVSQGRPSSLLLRAEIPAHTW